MNAFIDTNLAIAIIFYINSLHNASKNVFNTYSEFFWSYHVKDEFEERYIEKYLNLSNFFNDLQKYLENPEKEFYTLIDLKNFIRDNYSDKLMEDAMHSSDLNAANTLWSQSANVNGGGWGPAGDAPFVWLVNYDYNYFI